MAIKDYDTALSNAKKLLDAAGPDDGVLMVRVSGVTRDDWETATVQVALHNISKVELMHGITGVIREQLAAAPATWPIIVDVVSDLVRASVVKHEQH